jgi:predicted CoA-binding protein
MAHSWVPAASGKNEVPDPVTVLLEKYRTLAVVGLSSKVMRPSYGVAAYMQTQGYRIIPVNPNETSVLGEKAYPSLDEAPDPVEIVVIFRRSEFVPEIVEAAIRRGAKVIWMQEGVIHEAAARRARQAGLEVIQDRCILKEHAKRFVAEGI